MSQPIEAIYENGIFKPVGPVDLPDGTRVRVETTLLPADSDELIRQRLLTEQTVPAETERILENLQMLWDSYETLTEEQQADFDSAKLDQEHFFGHLSQR